MAHRPKMGEIYAEYVDRCFKAGAMDFDDLLLRTNELLNRFPMSWPSTKTVSAIFWWMSTKIPTTPSISLYVRFPTSFKIFVWWETMHRVSMLSAGRTSTTSSIFKRITTMLPCTVWSRTIALPKTLSMREFHHQPQQDQTR